MHMHVVAENWIINGGTKTKYIYIYCMTWRGKWLRYVSDESLHDMAWPMAAV